MRLYAVGIYYRLEDVVVYQLGENEYAYEYRGVAPETYVYAHRVYRVVFEYKPEESPYRPSDERPYVWDDVQQSCHKGDAHGHAESQSGHEMQAYGVYQSHAEDFDYETDEITAEQFVHVFYRFACLPGVFVVHEREDDVLEHVVIVYEEKRDEDDGEKPYADVYHRACRRAYYRCECIDVESRLEVLEYGRLYPEAGTEGGEGLYQEPVEFHERELDAAACGFQVGCVEIDDDIAYNRDDEGKKRKQHHKYRHYGQDGCQPFRENESLYAYLS